MSDNKETSYKRGSVVRLQLNPDNTDIRWGFDFKDQEWKDAGKGGAWVDATILVTTYEPGNWVGWADEPIAVLYFNRPCDNQEMRWNMPLEGNPQFPNIELEGFPRPSGKNILHPCGCGADTIYGKNNLLHQDYCPKLEGLRWLGHEI